MSSNRSRRPGRRPGGPDTRGQILRAAQEVFGERGYDAASMREIAERAGVNPALLRHYFGGKEKLFAAAVQLPFDPDDVAEAVASAEPGSRGERLTRVFFSVWEDPVRRAPVLAVFRSAIAHESAALLLRQFARRVMLARIAPSLEGPGAELRVEAALAHLLGLAMMRYAIRLEPMASAPVEEVIALVAPGVQRYFESEEG